MGPLISSRALEAVKRSIENATARGSAPRDRRWTARGLRRAVTSWSRPCSTTCRHGGCATREEVFGPVAAIVRVRDVEEAIALANDSEYGLGANIYTNNLRYVMTAMEEIKAGTFWVERPAHRQRGRPVRRHAPERHRPRAGRRGARRIPRAQARAHRLHPGAQELLVPVRRAAVVSRMDPLPLYIGGRFTNGAEPSQEIVNPATGIADRTGGARHARRRRRPRFRPLATRSIPARGRASRRPSAVRCCSRSRGGCAESAPELARLETENMGKPIVESEFDVADAATCFEYYGGPRQQDHRRRQPGSRRGAQPDAQRAGRRLRADHPVELPAADGRLEDRAGALRRVHGRPEAGRGHTGYSACARSHPGRHLGPAQGRRQRSHR